jgi:hypothetical protein
MLLLHNHQYISQKVLLTLKKIQEHKSSVSSVTRGKIKTSKLLAHLNICE